MDDVVKPVGRELLRLAREYLRVSMDRSGRARSNAEQQEDNRRSWPELAFGEPYDDVSISASRYSTKARDGYTELVADLRSGRFGADVLVLWESSRGSRRVGEWVELVDLCEKRVVQIAVTDHRRIYDPSNPRDRRSLLEDAVDAEYESGKTSRRLRRAQAANAAAGRPHGRVPFGYRRVYDERTGRLVGQVPEPAEAKVVREVYERIVAGHSLHGLEADFEARGLRTRSGTVWTHQQLRGMAMNRLYIAERVHAPGATVTERRQGKGASYTPAAWEPLVDRRTWLAVQRILRDPARRTHPAGSRPGKAKYLLSYLVVCDVCDGVIQAGLRRGERFYLCRDHGHVRVLADDLDELATKAIIAYLARPDHMEHLTADGRGDGELEKARTEVAEVQAELDDLADRLGRGELSATLAARSEPQIVARLHAAQQRERELATPSVLRGLIEPGADVAQRWEPLPMTVKRRIAKIVLAPDALGELRIRTGVRGHRTPIQDRVAWRSG